MRDARNGDDMTARSNGIAAISLLLCMAVILIGFCSYFAFAPIGQYWETVWDGNSSYRNRGWLAKNGSLHLVRSYRLKQPASGSKPQKVLHIGADPAHYFVLQPTTLGFAFVNHISSYRGAAGTSVQVDTMTVSQLSFPLWLLAILFGVCPTLWVVAAMRQRMRQIGSRCVHCGYDLRATPDRCPECGLVPKGKTA
jgi:hypothetical protein